MNLDDAPIEPVLGELNTQAAEIRIPELVAQVYESANPALRSRLLEQLLRPLGVLSLVAMANGIFAGIRFHSGRPDMHIQLEDAQKVQASDIAALVERVQQVSGDSINGLARMLSTSPMMTYSTATVLLVTILMQRTRTRRDGDGDQRLQRRAGHPMNETAP